jgi:glycine cleavage system H protein
VVVESVKSAGEIKAPVSGTVTAVNEQLTRQPELINSDALGAGWLYKMQPDNSGELDGLMDTAGYEVYLKSLA